MVDHPCRQLNQHGLSVMPDAPRRKCERPPPLGGKKSVQRVSALSLRIQDHVSGSCRIGCTDIGHTVRPEREGIE